MDKPSDFIIKPFRNHYVLINIKGKKENHTHLYTIKKCRNLVEMVCNKTVPTDGYLRESAKRVSRDEKYINKVNHKIKKDRNKQTYHNVINGIW